MKNIEVSQNAMRRAYRLMQEKQEEDRRLCERLREITANLVSLTSMLESMCRSIDAISEEVNKRNATPKPVCENCAVRDFANP